MKIAFISDIHSNLQALEAVISEIKKKYRTDYLVCPGDLVGYGPNPNEVCELLRGRKNFIAVKGNHDEAVLTGETRGFNRIAAKAVEWTRDHITDENLEFLNSLPNFKPLLLDKFKVFICHGSPRDYLDDYIYPNASEDLLKEFLEKTEANVVVVGHTHVSFYKEIGVRLFLNAGSVGQPRDGNEKACYVYMDTDRNEIKTNRVGYDIDKVNVRIKNSRLPNSLGNRLYYGV